jgi:putative peptidoglycan lipid II flippase
VHHLILFVDRAMATQLGSGKAAALNYAYHLALVVGQLSGLAVSTAVFPRLAEQIAKGDTAGARADLSDALRFVWATGLPAACGLIVLRTPIVRVLFERGAFGQAATAAVSGPLRWYALAVLADALCQPLWRVVYAQRRSWTVLGVNALQTGLRWAGNLAFAPLLGYHGLALSAAIGLSVQAALLGWLVKRLLGTLLPRAWWRDAVRVLLAAVAATAAVSLLLTVSAAGLGQVPPALKLATGGVAGGTVYLVALWLVGYRRRLWFERWANRF